MARTSLKALTRRRLREQLASVLNRSRYCDLQITVKAPANDQDRVTVGGRWDKKTRSYVGPASRAVPVMLSPSQVVAARELVRWMAKHAKIRTLVARGATFKDAEAKVWGDQEPVRSLVLFGGRRGGKSHLACLAVALFVVMVPGSRAVMLSPLQRDTAELRDALFSLLHAEWRAWREGRQEFRLINGSRIELKTGRKKQLKLGPIDIAVVNEAQEQAEQPCTDMRGNLADSSGLIIYTANPPRRKLGEWIQRLVWNIRDGLARSARRYFLDWRLNPYTNQRAILAMAEGMTELERRREIDGDMDLPVGDLVLTSFGEHNILRQIPITWRRRDVTAQVLERYFGVRGCVRVLGVDFDKRAGCSWATGKFYLPTPRSTLEDAVLVIDYGGRYASDPESAFGANLASERDRAGRILFDPETTLIVADHSGKTQSTERQARRGDERSQRLDPASWRRLQMAGWLHIIGPDPNMARNPLRRDRFDLTRDVLRCKSGRKPRVMFVRLTAAEVIESARMCPREGSETGNPNDRSEHAHVLDCWSYISWRRWGAEWLELLASLRQTAPEMVVVRRRGHG